VLYTTDGWTLDYMTHGSFNSSEVVTFGSVVMMSTPFVCPEPAVSPCVGLSRTTRRLCLASHHGSCTLNAGGVCAQ
jgi:hypothetical protein